MTHWTEEFFVKNADLYTHELREMEEFANTQVENLLTLLSEEHGATPSTVLDVGCGLGRHCIEFARAGLDVTGIDISSEYLAAARDRAVEAGVVDSTSFRELDMRELDSLQETFDLVVCLYNTLGYFDDETNIQVLEQMESKLAEEGICVVSVKNKDTAIRNFQSDGVRELEFGMVVAQYEFTTEISRMTITRDVLRGTAPDYEYDGRVEYKVRLYSPPELEQAFHDAGFDQVRLFGGYGGESLSLETGKIVSVAR